MKKFRKGIAFKQTSVDETNYIVRGKFSTGTEDRDGEIIDQKGWRLDDFMRNPVILFAHDHYQPAVGKCVEIGLDQDGDLAGAIQFAVNENDDAMSIFKLYAGGFMRAFSVGFENIRYEYDEVNDRTTLLENVLYEISCVNVPAAADALAAQSGIDMAPVRKMMAKALWDNEGKTPSDDGGKMATKEEKQVEAVAILAGAPKEKLRSAIRALTEALNDGTEPDTAEAEGTRKVERPAGAGGIKKIPVKLINRAVKELLAAKKNH